MDESKEKENLLVWFGFMAYQSLFSAKSIFIHIDIFISTNPVKHSLNVKIVLFQTIQFSISTV